MCALPLPRPRNADRSLARFGDFEVDFRAGELRHQGRRLRLQDKPLLVLEALLESPGEVVLREELRARLWSGDTFVDFDNNLNTAVSKLREVLGDSAERPRYLETVPKRGYRLRVPVEWPERHLAAMRLRRRRRAGTGAALAAIAAFVFWLGAARRPGPTFPREEPRSPNAGAFEAYMQGRYLATKSDDPVSRRESIGSFRRAIALDPDYAPAYVGLSSSLFTFRERPLGVVPEAKALAERAVRIDPALPEAHHRLAVIRLYFDWDWEGARREFERAIQLDPGKAEFHRSYAAYFAMLGRHAEALAEMGAARALDPVSVDINADAGWYLYDARQFDAAILQSRRALELEPRHWWAHMYILLSYLAKGDEEAALAWAQRLMRLGDATAGDLATLASGSPAQRLRSFWRWHDAQLAKRGVDEYVAPAERALVAVELGEHARALALLEESIRERSGWVLPFLAVYPELDPLRADPRFQALVARLRLDADPGSAARG
jgi:DNA-binding winged helix-turn-helix (wHTH) protein/tetratricopeptide (TPR) repeat protein